MEAASESPVTPSLAIVIPSRKREHMVAKAAALFKDPIICIDELELDEYQKAAPNLRYLAHPAKYNNLQLIRQWILDNVHADIVFQCDDDVHSVWSICGHQSRRIKDPETIEDVILNAGINCMQAGTVLFFFAHTPDPKEASTLRPFRLVSQPVGCAMGFIREPFNDKIRFDPAIQHGGLEAALRTMYHFRIVWCDARYAFKPGPHMTLQGGLAGVRTVEGMSYDDAILRRRYGSAIEIDHYKKANITKRGGRRRHVTIHVRRHGERAGKRKKKTGMDDPQLS